MKKIILIRHAKSDWSIPGIGDIDRPLNDRGYSDAHRVGAELKKSISEKTIFVTSPAIRAMSTSLIIARETKYPQGKIMICPELYDAERGDYESVIQSLDNNFECVLIFGHNPTISEVINKLLRTDVGEISTCSVFALTFEIKGWEDIIGTKGKIDFQLSPKTL